MRRPNHVLACHVCQVPLYQLYWKDWSDGRKRVSCGKMGRVCLAKGLFFRLPEILEAFSETDSVVVTSLLKIFH